MRRTPLFCRAYAKNRTGPVNSDAAERLLFQACYFRFWHEAAGQSICRMSSGRDRPFPDSSDIAVKPPFTGIEEIGSALAPRIGLPATPPLVVRDYPQSTSPGVPG